MLILNNTFKAPFLRPFSNNWIIYRTDWHRRAGVSIQIAPLILHKWSEIIHKFVVCAFRGYLQCTRKYLWSFSLLSWGRIGPVVVVLHFENLNQTLSSPVYICLLFIYKRQFVNVLSYIFIKYIFCPFLLIDIFSKQLSTENFSKQLKIECSRTLSGYIVKLHVRFLHNKYDSVLVIECVCVGI